MGMRKGLIFLSSIICLLLLTINANAANDNPHDTSNTVSCSSCHFSYGSAPSWYTQGTDPGNPDSAYPFNRLCWSCHTDSGGSVPAPFRRTHSNFVIYGVADWTRECRECHNPHYQRQSRRWKSSSYLYSSTSTSVTSSTITRTGAGWTVNDWQGRVVIGNTSQPNYNYRILSNTSDTLTVQGTINTSYVKAGNTFAIVYGKLVKDYINSKDVRFFRDQGANSFADGDGTYDGICEVCHTTTAYHKNDGTGASHNAGANCNTCHIHTDGFAPTAGCTNCHGYPPVDTSTLVDFTNPSATGSTTAGAHNTHANTLSVACGSCHLDSVGTGTLHNNAPTPPREVTMGFSLINGAYLGGTYNGQAGVLYNTSETNTTVTNDDSKTCSNIYCHSNVQANGGGGGRTYATPSWDNQAPNNVVCGSCHKSDGAQGNATLMDSGNHTKHVATPLSKACSTCHSGAGSGTANHVNNNINITFASGYGGSYSQSPNTPGNGYGACSSVYCHSNVQGANGNGSPTSYNSPSWGGAALTCATSCHSGTPATGNHTTHTSTPYSYTCVRCHNNAGDATVKHADNNIDMSFNLTFSYTSGSYSQSPNTPGGGYGSCSNVYCHSIAQTATGGALTGAGGEYKTPTWGGGALACDACHGNPSSSGAHTKHATTYGFTCAQCHNSQVPPGVSTHVDGSINTAINATWSGTYNGDTTPANGFSNCSNTYCHSIGIGGTSNTGDTRTIQANTSPSWGGSATCTSCHGNISSTDGRPDYPSNDAGYQNKKNSHNLTKHSSMSCDKCHYQTTTTGNTITTISNHVNKLYNVDGTGTEPYTFTYAYNVNGGACSASYCHGTAASPAWGTSGTLQCSSCHTSMGAGGTAAYTGKHQKHADTTTYDFSCEMCHSQGAGTVHVNGPVVANTQSAELIFRNTSTTWQTGQTYNSSTSTYRYRSLANNPYDSEAAITPSYTSTGTTQTDQQLEWRDAGTCGTVWCHSNANPMSGVNAYQAGLAWNSTITCTSCHAGGGASTTLSTKHPAHTSASTYNYGCQKCHNATTTTGNTITTYTEHVDGQKDVAWDSTNTGGDAYSSPNCTNIYCHSQGTAATTPYSAPNTAAAWNGTLDATCTGCHSGNATVTNKMSTGTHAGHINNAGIIGTNYTCDICHSATVSSGTDRVIGTYANHVNKEVNVAFTALNTGAAYSGSLTPGDAYGTCSNLYCHSTGKNGIVNTANLPGVYGGSHYTNRDWGGAGISCNGCHGRSNSKAYPDYTSVGVGQATSNSHYKHADATQSNFGCQQCHNNTTIDGSNIKAGSTQHIDSDVQDIAFTGDNSSGTFDSVNRTCSTTYCHGTSASPGWGGATQCNSCHGATNAMPGRHGTHYAVATVADSADRTPANNSTATDYEYSCGVCHDSTSHAQGKISADQYAEVSFNAGIAGAGATHTPGAYAGSDNGFRFTAATCSTYCHSNGNGGNPNVTAFNWNSAQGTLNCAGCHNSTAASGTAMATGSHASHMNNDSVIGSNYGCAECHDATVSISSDTTITNKANHADTQKDVSIRLSGTWLSPNCTSTYCHSSGKGIYENPPSWGSATNLGCNGCHGTTTTGGTPDYANGGAGTANANSHSKHAAASSDCNTCHKDTTTTGLAIKAGSTLHTNNALDVTFDTTKAGAGATWVGGVGNKTCSSIYCHGSNTPQWGATLNCAGCHEASNLLASRHAQHYATGTNATSNTTGRTADGANYIFNCGTCHNPSITQHAGGAANPVSGRTAEISFNVTWATGYTNGSYTEGGTITTDSRGFKYSSNNTCTNLYCHSDGKPLGAADPTYATATWNQGAASPNCGICHAATPATNKHTAHASTYSFGCVKCHSNTVSDNTTISNKDNHVNFAKDVAWDSTNTGGMTYSSPSCTNGTTNIYCHSQGTSNSANYPSPNIAAAWNGSLDATCTGCHNGYSGATNKMSSGTHTAHINNAGVIGSNYTCQMCHNATVTGNTTISGYSSHVNKQVNVSFTALNPSGAYSGSVTPGDAYGNCSTAYCHSNGKVGTTVEQYVDRTWGGGTIGCTGCHGTTTTAGTPDYTNAGAGTVGANSHNKHAGSSTTCVRCHSTTTTTGTTITGTVHTDGTRDVAAGPGVSFTYAPQTCSSISCHFNGTATWGATLACDACHGLPPATGAHLTHTDGTGAAYGNDSNSSITTAYRFNCGNCHPLNSANHANGTTDIELYNASATGFKANNPATASRTGSGNTTVCSDVYCHSNGASGGDRAYKLTPQWDSAFGANKCGGCHDNPPQYAGQSHYVATGFMGKEGGHLVGIHFDNIYNGVAGSGLLTAGTTNNSSHGNTLYSTTISCYICHNGEVSSTTIDTYALNNLGASSMKCANCHPAGAVPLQNGVIDDKSIHINAAKNVNIANMANTMRSKAQLRTASKPAIWTQNVGYKVAGSYDSATLNSTDWNSGTKTCTTACHNNQPVVWGATNVDCLSCHTRL